MVIKIEGLTEAQEIAMQDFMSKIQDCVDSKASRWIGLFADGGNEWKGVKILVNDALPVGCNIPENCQRWWQVYFKEDENKYTPEPFYLAESYTIAKALEEKNEKNDKTDD